MSILVETPAVQKSSSLTQRFYFTAWRWHFYAGLYVAPFLIMLAVTGLVMLWSAVLVGRDGEKVYAVSPSGVEAPMVQQAEAALSAVPGGALVQYIAPRTSEQAAIFRVNLGDASTMVAVDPYSAAVLGSWERRHGLYDLADTIHGTLLIGDIGDRFIEVAAGFGVVLIITGLYLWWPRNGGGLSSVLVPRLSASGRQLWKSLHQTVGFYASLILLVFLLSGLTWAGVWGEKFTQAWSTFPAEKWDNVPLSDVTHASMNHGGIKEVPWTLEKTRMPASGSQSGIPGMAQGEPVNFGSVVAFARQLGFDHRFELAFPSGETGVWTISHDTMSNDGGDPTSDRTVHIDRYSGNVLADVAFKDYGLAGKAMAIGIAFHEGDMGTWNIALVTLYCLSVIFLSVSGVVIWWKRRPNGARRLVAPNVPDATPVWKVGMVIMVAVSLLFPLTGAVLITVLAFDMLIVRYFKPLKRILS